MGLADEAADFVGLAGAGACALAGEPNRVGMNELDRVGSVAQAGEVGVLPEGLAEEEAQGAEAVSQAADDDSERWAVADFSGGDGPAGGVLVAAALQQHGGSELHLDTWPGWVVMR